MSNTITYPDSQYPGKKFVKYPLFKDYWTCCNANCYKFSEIINHIEKFHITNQIQFTEQGNIFKFSCHKCDSKFIEHHKIAIHYLENHIEHQIICTQCCVHYFTFEKYKEHIRDCNIVAFENKRNWYSLPRKTREQISLDIDDS